MYTVIGLSGSWLSMSPSEGANGLRCEVFSRRTFAPSDGLMLNHEPLNPITVYKIQRGC